MNAQYLTGSVGAALLALVSCTTPIQPGATGRSVEDLERESPVTGVPDVREGEAARAAASYSGNRGYRGYGGGYYHPRPYHHY